MKVVFAGTPAFAQRALEALARSGHEVALVLSQPDRPSGRGLTVTPGPVKAYALANGWPVLQPHSLSLGGTHADEALQAHERLRAVAADVMVVAAYGLILPQSVLTIPRLGCVNIHASLLPRWRGAAPIQRAIEAGDALTGITIMQMDVGLDTGPVISQFPLTIAPDDTADSLALHLAELGARQIVEALAALKQGAVVQTPQSLTGVTYARKITKTDAHLQFDRSAYDLARLVRALYPAPGAVAQYGASALKIWRAWADGDASGAPGRVCAIDAHGIRIGCARGQLVITELQRPGGQRLACADFLRGFPIEVGGVFT